MKPETKKWMAVIVFYVIAVVIRALALQLEVPGEANWKYFLIDWATGIGPCIGALVAVLAFRRKFICSISGTSLVKSALCVLIPFLICFFLYRALSWVLLGFLFYSFLEEVGWRGYLQGELADMKAFPQALLIGAMWFFWHIHITFSVNGLIFLVILVFGAWGIGRIAKDTHSLIACACFHTLYNFSIHGFFHFTPAVMGIYVGVIVSWFLIWYAPWEKIFSGLRSNRAA